MIDYIGLILLSFLVFIFTTIMAIAGVGAAFIIIPLLYYFGYDFLMVTAIGLFLNSLSTGTASIRHAKNHAINLHIALPIIVSSAIFTPIGAYLSGTISRSSLKLLFALFLLLVGCNMFYKLWQELKIENDTAITSFNGNKIIIHKLSKPLMTQTAPTSLLIISLVTGALVGLIAGLLGVGGGSLILPVLLWFGLETKKAAGTTSFIVVFSSIIGFISKFGLTGIEIDLP